MPLTRRVTFKITLQERQPSTSAQADPLEFKLELNQVLKVGVTAVNMWNSWQHFYAKNGKKRTHTHLEVNNRAAKR